MPHHGEYDEAWLLARGFSRIATGTYTGDGTLGQAIVGVGFSPMFVRITPDVADGANAQEYWKYDVQPATESITHGNWPTYFDNDRIISLDADGFTVDDQGADLGPNTNLALYYYCAWG